MLIIIPAIILAIYIVYIAFCVLFLGTHGIFAFLEKAKAQTWKKIGLILAGPLTLLFIYFGIPAHEYVGKYGGWSNHFRHTMIVMRMEKDLSGNGMRGYYLRYLKCLRYLDGVVTNDCRDEEAASMLQRYQLHAAGYDAGVSYKSVYVEHYSGS